MREILRSQEQDWSTLKDLDDDAWVDALNNRYTGVAQRKEAPDWEWVHAEMQRPEATLEALWREWRETCPEGIGYSRFTDSYRAWTKARHVVMRKAHKPGEKLFVDYAGRIVEIKDRNGGPSTFAQIFVAVLGHSNYTFIRATGTQTTADWVRAHVEAFHALGGVPEWVVPDNLKAAVSSRERDRIVINPAYQEVLRHYDTAAVPARPRRPKDKAKAEVGVQIAQRWVLFALRDRVFFSLTELNAELERLGQKLNDHPFKRMVGCRRERFEMFERGALKPLPQTPFVLSDWRYGVMVGDDYHVEHKRAYYSVPHYLSRERVDLRFTATSLEIMYKGRRIALHPMLDAGEVSTTPEHRPIAHARVLEGEPKALLAWAEGVGPGTRALIRHHLEDRSDAANGLRAARRLRELARLYGEARFEEASLYATSLNITALRSIESILRQSPDKIARPTAPAAAAPRIHEHVRGASYYGEVQ